MQAVAWLTVLAFGWGSTFVSQRPRHANAVCSGHLSRPSEGAQATQRLHRVRAHMMSAVGEKDGDVRTGGIEAKGAGQRVERVQGTGRISGERRERAAAKMATKKKLEALESEVKKDESGSQLPLPAIGLAGLAALAIFAAMQTSNQEQGVDPVNSYYVSSSSYVIQSSRGDDGQLRTQVQEDSGVWTNIPGLQGKRQQAREEGDARQAERAQARLRAAQKDVVEAQEQIDQALADVNKELARAFGTPLLGTYGGYDF